MNLIPDGLVSRFSLFKKYAKINNFNYGKYWNEAGETFDIELTNAGFVNKGKRNYLPSIYEKGKKFNYFLDINKKKNKKKIKIIQTKEYTEINGKKFCDLKYGNNAIYHANNYYDIIVNNIDYIPKKILEVGAGSGVLSSLLKNQHDSQITIIDISSVISCSIAFFMYVFPEKLFCLPNEIEKQDLKSFDFIFLLPHQLNYLNNYEEQDLIINTQSFMEMDYQEVDNYFKFIKEKTKNGGYFFCSNRTRKINKFFDYPWSKLNNFKKTYIGINEIASKEALYKSENKTTMVDFLLKKDIKQNFKRNNLTFLERLFYKNFFYFRERMYWLKIDFKIYKLIYICKKLIGIKTS